jgi:hypothetical protein
VRRALADLSECQEVVVKQRGHSLHPVRGRISTPDVRDPDTTLEDQARDYSQQRIGVDGPGTVSADD